MPQTGDAATAAVSGDAAAPQASAPAADPHAAAGHDDHGGHEVVAAQAEGLNTPIIIWVGIFIAASSLLMIFGSSALYYEGQHIEDARKQRQFDERAADRANAADADTTETVQWTVERDRVAIPVDRAIDMTVEDQDFGPVSSVQPENASD